jgi:hypothetical protein
METQFMGKLFGVSQKNLDSFSCLSWKWTLSFVCSLF